MTLKSDPKKSLFLRNMQFLCDAIDLNLSVESTLKVWGKSLTTVLDDAHFIVNLYSFPLPLVSQTNSSFPKFSHLPPSLHSNFQNIRCFSDNPSFLRISQIHGKNQENGKQSLLLPLSFKINLKNTYFYKLPSALSLSRMVAGFSCQIFMFYHMREKFLNLWTSHS